jgi:hypothetical protein
LGYQGILWDAFKEVSCFRTELYVCLTARSDVLFEICDALLCTDGPVRTLVDLALAPEHRRGHGALYDGLNQGRIDIARLRRASPVRDAVAEGGGRSDHAGCGRLTMAAAGRQHLC